MTRGFACFFSSNDAVFFSCTAIEDLNISLIPPHSVFPSFYSFNQVLHSTDGYKKGNHEMGSKVELSVTLNTSFS